VVECARLSAVEPVTCPADSCSDVFIDCRRLKEHVKVNHSGSGHGLVVESQYTAATPEPTIDPPVLDADVTMPSSQGMCSSPVQPCQPSDTLEELATTFSQKSDPTFLPSIPHQTMERPRSKEHLDGSRSYLLSNDIFEHLGIRYHTHYKTIHCVCEQAVLPDAILSHIKSHGVKVGSEMRKEMEENLQNILLVKTTQEVVQPLSGGPPVELLKMVDGHCCVECSYAAPAARTLQNHWHSTHGKSQTVSPNLRYIKGTLQTFFQHFGQHYFQVNPALTALSADDTFAIYMRDHVPKFPAFPAPPPLTEREIPPLLHVTQWHEHLSGYTTNTQTRQELISLVNLKSSSAQGGLKKVGEVCFEYLKDIRAKANRSTLGMRTLLMECPR
jgi:Protein of unknown function (DUF3505).